MTIIRKGQKRHSSDMSGRLEQNPSGMKIRILSDSDEMEIDFSDSESDYERMDNDLYYEDEYGRLREKSNDSLLFPDDE